MRLSSAPVPPFGSQTRWTEVAESHLKLATPMLGGGSRAGHPDDDQPIRPSSVRGALRRWWRAGTAFSSFEDLKGRERALWGMADGREHSASKVRIQVDVLSASPKTLLRDADAPAYAHGILVPKKGEELLHVVEKCSFRITVSALSSLSEREIGEVRQALAAWVAYGGIGSRTRRGFGSLQWESGTELKVAVPAQSELPTVSGFTSLIGARLFLRPAGGAKDAWKGAVETLRDFRKGQMTNHPRPSSGIASHSPWPEADSLRREKGRRTLDQLDSPTYPRAELGLPLQIRSVDKPGTAFSSSWIPGTAGGTRLASPVICKPVYRDGSWHAGILLMARGRLDDIRTDATGYPRNLHGLEKYRGEIQKRPDIVGVFAEMLRLKQVYDYRESPLD